jgi:dTDP-4-amino-4,6-dideoxygalactose transaminase
MRRTTLDLSQLAINGGPKVRTEPWPGRGCVGLEEKAAVDALFDEAIASGNAFGYNGPAEEAYCREFAEFMGDGYVDAVNSGTAAIYVALRALNPEPFTEIIVAAVTDPGGMMPIVLLNCIPVVADAIPGSYNTGPQQIEELISPLTSVIVVSHIAGEPADIEGVMTIARRRGIPVVEDCAQAHGAKINGRYVGSFGDIAAFSTMFGKHHVTGGQGGLVYTRNEHLYWAARRASDRGKPFGLPAGSSNCIATLNLNLNDLAATIGRVQLKKLPGIIKGRQGFVARIAEGLKDVEAVSLPLQLPHAEPSYWFLRLQFHPEAVTCDKETFCQALIAEGLPVNPSYKAALPHLMDWYRNRHVFGSSGYPWAGPAYKGDPDRRFPCPNAMAVMETHFNVSLSESWGEREVADILTAFRKVETAYLR